MSFRIVRKRRFSLANHQDIFPPLFTDQELHVSMSSRMGHQASAQASHGKKGSNSPNYIRKQFAHFIHGILEGVNSQSIYPQVKQQKYKNFI